MALLVAMWTFMLVSLVGIGRLLGGSARLVIVVATSSFAKSSSFGSSFFPCHLVLVAITSVESVGTESGQMFAIATSEQ